MNQFYLIGIYATLCIAFMGIVHRRSGDYMHPHIVFTGTYFFYTTGPIILYLLGRDIYGGIRTEYIRKSMIIFIIAVIGIFTSVIINLRIKKPVKYIQYLPDNNRKFLLLFLDVLAIFMNLIVYGIIINDLGFIITHPKGYMFLGRKYFEFLHYNYLLLWFMIIPLFLAAEPRFNKAKVFFINWVFYIAYCVLTGERDYVLNLIPIIIYFKYKKEIKKPIFVFGIILIFVFLLQTINRDLEPKHNLLYIIMSQGSNLNVITNVTGWIEEGETMQYGRTYINSLLNLIPSFIYRESMPLNEWFKNKYAPGSNSGYGFSQESEGYLNFGLPGVFMTFFLIGKMLIYTYEKMKTGSIYGKYLHLFFVPFMLYAIRGDSLMIFKATLYAIVFFYGIIFFVNNGKLYLRRNAINYCN